MKCSLQAAPWPQCFLPTTSTWESAWQLIQVPWWTFCWSRLWNTLRWFPSKFGLPGPDSMARLKAKRKTIQEGLVDTHIKFPRKAQLHPKRAYWHGKRLQPGDFAVTTGTDKLSPKQLMDKYICAMVAFQVACCSARFDDLSTYQHQATAGGPSPFKGGHRGAGDDRCGRMLDRYICAMTRFQVACNARSMTSNIPAPRVANSRRPPRSSRLGRPRPSGPFGSRRTRPL